MVIGTMALLDSLFLFCDLYFKRFFAVFTLALHEQSFAFGKFSS